MTAKRPSTKQEQTATVVQHAPANAPVSTFGLQERLMAALDGLLNQTLPVEQGNAIANIATASALHSRIESQMIEVATERNRTILGRTFSPQPVEAKQEQGAQQLLPAPTRIRAMPGGRS